jgi:hypothetical protein
MLKNVSEVALVTKNIFFLKILNYVQSFVKCKVSLADGNFVYLVSCMQEHCYRHFDGEKECGGIMSSLKSTLLGGDGHDQHEHGHHLDHSDSTSGSKKSVWDGAVGGEREQSGNDVDSALRRGESAEAEPSTNAASSRISKTLTSLLVALASPAVFLFFAL